MTIRGHAVRALYLLAGATDVYTETGREELLTPIHAQWRDMVSSKTYLTGGIGSRHVDEAFGDAYELPPDRGYCETCAAIASIMWNWRLLLLTGDSVHAELMERTLYNGFLSGLGLDGTSFFYVNPLQAREPSSREAWYTCACCPPNIMRLLASLDHYVATRTDDGVQLHQYAGGRIRDERGGAEAFELEVTTGYPVRRRRRDSHRRRAERLARARPARAALGRWSRLHGQRQLRGGRAGRHRLPPASS